MFHHPGASVIPSSPYAHIHIHIHIHIHTHTLSHTLLHAHTHMLTTKEKEHSKNLPPCQQLLSGENESLRKEIAFLRKQNEALLAMLADRPGAVCPAAPPCNCQCNSECFECPACPDCQLSDKVLLAEVIVPVVAEELAKVTKSIVEITLGTGEAVLKGVQEVRV